MARGAVVPLATVWTLTVPWYASRLDYDWMPRSPAEVERLLMRAGLTDDFWRV